ncbi:hypothetical protein F383_09974 [Gossypium arboreum]|uniref:Uncharacterized protein n=1 Tax=Gossypium arboreum TaxID=29729 RepID=A0A0B0P4C4_GOSAR|nr:hypothetical protein F383_09974 [Gossypium arboreum]
MQQPPQLMNITTEHIQKDGYVIGEDVRKQSQLTSATITRGIPSIPAWYEPNTIDLSDHKELEYWFTVLSEHLPDLVDKGYC